MIICGIKLTHDGGIALIDNGELKFSIEMEKLDNNYRYSPISDLSVIPELLEANGYSVDKVDKFVLDGWFGSGDQVMSASRLKVRNAAKEVELEVAVYNERQRTENVLERFTFNADLPMGGKNYSYSSYMHVAGHIASAYCTSPMAALGQNSYVLTWDGGQYPRLYYFDFKTRKVTNIGHLFLFLGSIYSIFAEYFGPYKLTEAELAAKNLRSDDEGLSGGLSVAGKIMSYIALGKVRPALFPLFDKIRKKQTEISNKYGHEFSQQVRKLVDPDEYSDEDCLATMHSYLEKLLIEKLQEKIGRSVLNCRNLCFSGGCALNIKWNSAIRSCGLFDTVYVPPFPNDSGSAIGAACNEYLYQTGGRFVTWSVYSGPVIRRGGIRADWLKEDCSIGQLALHLYQTGEPAVFLNGAAELGPRALGNRSILASPVDPKTKDLLNQVKKREFYRPVAPICLESMAPEVFAPGTKDKFMLFDHKIWPEWIDRIPAVCHLDGTARLQTVSQKDNKEIFDLLTEFYRLSGIPCLCNTSANLNGCGFFPDVASALEWGQLNYVWCDNTLYTKQNKNDFSAFKTLQKVAITSDNEKEEVN